LVSEVFYGSIGSILVYSYFTGVAYDTVFADYIVDFADFGVLKVGTDGFFGVLRTLDGYLFSTIIFSFFYGVI